jgi:hypothetical protein
VRRAKGRVLDLDLEKDLVVLAVTVTDSRKWLPSPPCVTMETKIIVRWRIAVLAEDTGEEGLEAIFE